MTKDYALLAVSILFNSLSVVLMKKAATVNASFMANIFSLTAWMQLITNLYMVLSVLFFVLGTATWFLVLTKLDLSLAYPAVSISYIIIALASQLFFGETITLARWIGIVIIMAGVSCLFK